METHDTERVAGHEDGDDVVHSSPSAGELSTSETPEDVAVLYSWANLQGAKYRDFSASRREYRAQMRHRAAELLHEQELKASAEAEATAAAAEAEAALAAKVAELAEHPDPQEAEYARQLALYEADQAARKAAAERLEAVRRADAAAYAASVAEHEAREIAEAQASSIRQAAQYAESEVRLRQSGIHARAAVPGKISDPYAPPELAEGGEFDQPGTPVAELEATRFRKVREHMDQGSGANHRAAMPHADGHRVRGYRPDEPSGVRPPVAGDGMARLLDSRGMERPRRSNEPGLNAHSNYEHGLPSTPYSEYKRATGAEWKIPPRPEMPDASEREAVRESSPRPDAPIPSHSLPEPSPKRPIPPARIQDQPGWDTTRFQPRSQVQAYTAGALENEASQNWQLQPEAITPPAPLPPSQGYTTPPFLSQPPVRSALIARQPASFDVDFARRGDANSPTGASDAAAPASSRRAEAAPSVADRSFSVPPVPERAGPAWLYPSPQEITRLRPAAVSPAAPVSSYPGYRSPLGSDSGQKANPPAPFDTLQHSREHVASRWYALKGVFDHPNRTSTTEGSVSQSDDSVTPILAVFSLAGGVGKTSLVATLGRTLSSMGEKVLLTDTTSHGLLPYYFGASELLPGVIRTFSPPSGSPDAPIYLVSYELASYDGESPAIEQSERTRDDRGGHHVGKRAGERLGPDEFSQQIVRDGRGMHRVLLDLTSCSTPVARRLARLKPTVLVPLAPDMNSVISLQSVRRFFRTFQDADGQVIEPYFVLNQFDSALPLHLDVREVLSQQLGKQLLPFVIRRTPSVSEALAEGMTVVDYAPDSAIAQDYRNVATWLRGVSAPLNAAARSARWSER